MNTLSLKSQGLSSLQMNATSNVSQMPLGQTNTSGLNNLNWFSADALGASSNSMPLGGQSSLVNPFMGSAPAANSSLGGLASGNILNFDLKPNGGSSPFNVSNPTAGSAPNAPSSTNHLTNFGW